MNQGKSARKTPTITSSTKLSPRYSESLSNEELLDTVYVEAIPDHIQQGIQAIRKHDYQTAEDQFASALSISASEGDSRDMLVLHKHLGKIWMQVYSVRRALVHFKQWKDNADLLQNYIEKMKAYRNIGYCYQLARKYDIALNYFKKLLELAWYRNNVEMELLAYDWIGKQYYYMGEMGKAQYYNNRVWKGLTENKTSAARLMSKHIYEARKKRYPHEPGYRSPVQADSLNSSDVSDAELPSPMSNSSGPASFSRLPYMSEESSTPKLPPIQSPRGKLQLETPTPKYAKTSRNGIRPYILISHLSLNRSLKNYRCLKDARKIKVRRHKNIGLPQP